MPTLTRYEEFKRNFQLSINAAISLVVVRTNSPQVAADGIKEVAWSRQGRHFSSWDMVNGLRKWNRANPENAPTADDATKALPSAVMKIITQNRELMKQQETSGEESPGNLFSLLWPQHFISQAPMLLTALAEISTEFVTGDDRVALIVPMDWTCPPELETFVRIIELDPPSSGELSVRAAQLLEDVEDANIPDFTDDQVAVMGNLGAGMSMTEFDNAVSLALTSAGASDNPWTVDQFNKVIMDTKVEVVRRSNLLEVVPTSGMSEVGGLGQLKDWVEKRRWALDPEAISMGVDRAKGLAMVGPPGTGKSLVSKAIASRLGVPLVILNVSSLLGGVVGATEGNTRMALSMIKSLAPCAVMVDEIDKVFDMGSGGGDSGVGKRLLGQILTFMQEDTSGVFWIMSANRTQGLPPELLRKGRLDEVFSVTIPSPQERGEVLDVHMRKRNFSTTGIEGSKTAAIDASEGFVPAEIEGAIKEAAIEAYSKWIDEGKVGEMSVSWDDVVSAMRNVRPLSVSFASDFEAMRAWSEQHARPSGSLSTAEQQAADLAAEAIAEATPSRRRRRTTTSKS